MGGSLIDANYRFNVLSTLISIVFGGLNIKYHSRIQDKIILYAQNVCRCYFGNTSSERESQTIIPAIQCTFERITSIQLYGAQKLGLEDKLSLGIIDFIMIVFAMFSYNASS